MKILYFILSFFFILPTEVFCKGNNECNYYVFPPKDDYENSFLPFILNPPQKDQPIIFYILKNDETENYINSATTIIKNGSKWFSSQFNSQEKFFITGIKYNDNNNFAESWEMPSYFIKWDQTKLQEKENLFRSLKLKKDFLSLPSSQLNRIISSEISKIYSDEYIRFDNAYRKFLYSQIPVEEFSSFLIYELDKNGIADDRFPNIAAFRKTAMENEGAPIIYNELISKNQKEKFNSDIVKWSPQLDFEESQFLLNNIIQNKISLETYYNLLKLMDKIKVNYKNEYPEYFKYIFSLAWQNEFRKPSVQNELKCAINAVYAKLSPIDKNPVLEKIIKFNDSLFTFVTSEITYEEYKSLLEGLVLNPETATDEPTKKIITRIKGIWTEFTQKKLNESLDIYLNYNNLFKNDFNIISDKLNSNSSNLILIMGEDKEIPPFLFWFSHHYMGPFIKISSFNRQTNDNLGTERYFELMKGERSHFEKMLEGVDHE